MTLLKRTAVPVVLATAAVALSATCGVASAATSVTPVKSLLVPASVLGSGYTSATIPGGSSLGQDTLTFCAKTLPSDADRAARLQVEFRPTLKTKPDISEEIVRYKTGDGAAARKDLASAKTLCPKKITFKNGNGGTSTESVAPVSLHGAPAGTLVFKSFFSAKDPGKAAYTDQQYFYFTTKGDYLVGVYGGISKADVAATLKVVKVAVAKLAGV